MDLLVEDRIVVELKSVEQLLPVHSKQLLTYLRVLKLPVGLLINFGAATLKSGLRGSSTTTSLPPLQLGALRVSLFTSATPRELTQT